MKEVRANETVNCLIEAFEIKDSTILREANHLPSLEEFKI
jgi:hypothetical protein